MYTAKKTFTDERKGQTWQTLFQTKTCNYTRPYRLINQSCNKSNKFSKNVTKYYIIFREVLKSCAGTLFISVPAKFSFLAKISAWFCHWPLTPHNFKTHPGIPHNWMLLKMCLSNIIASDAMQSEKIKLLREKKNFFLWFKNCKKFRNVTTTLSSGAQKS